MNYYSILGVNKSASAKIIRNAFKKKARSHHPDKNNGDDTEFKKINEAYRVLSDPFKKQQYDLGVYDSAGPNISADDVDSMYENFQKMMSDFAFNFNGPGGMNVKISREKKRPPKKGEDISYNISVNLEDVYNKKIKKFKVERKRNLNGIYQNEPKEFDLPLYKSEIVFINEGHEVINAQDKDSPGHILINLFDKKDPNFKRINECDLLYQLDVTPCSLYRDKAYEICLLDGKLVKLKVCKEKLLETRFIEIENLGLPNPSNGEQRGKLIIYFNIIFRSLDYKQVNKLGTIFEPVKEDCFTRPSDFNLVPVLDIVDND